MLGHCKTGAAGDDQSRYWCTVVSKIVAWSTSRISGKADDNSRRSRKQTQRKEKTSSSSITQHAEKINEKKRASSSATAKISPTQVLDPKAEAYLHYNIDSRPPRSAMQRSSSRPQPPGAKWSPEWLWQRPSSGSEGGNRSSQYQRYEERSWVMANLGFCYGAKAARSHFCRLRRCSSASASCAAPLSSVDNIRACDLEAQARPSFISSGDSKVVVRKHKHLPDLTLILSPHAVYC